jgi:hypothetical protein
MHVIIPRDILGIASSNSFSSFLLCGMQKINANDTCGSILLLSNSELYLIVIPFPRLEISTSFPSTIFK